jgi:hypothetical protein
MPWALGQEMASANLIDGCSALSARIHGLPMRHVQALVAEATPVSRDAMVVPPVEQAGTVARIVTPSSSLVGGQVLETSSLSLDEFVFASRTRKVAVGKQRDVIDAFRTVCWFHQLRLAAGATSVYQMDALIEGPAGTSFGEDRKSKWRDYARGRHTPTSSIVTTAEARFPSSSAVIYHPLWDALNDRANSQIDGVTWRSEPPVFSLLRRGIEIDGRAASLRAPWRSTLSGALERRVGLDALACFVVAMRLAAAEKKMSLVSELSRSACRVLLMIGGWLWSRGIASPLGEYIERCWLPRVAGDHPHYGFGRKDSSLERDGWRRLRYGSTGSPDDRSRFPSGRTSGENYSTAMGMSGLGREKGWA